MQATFVPSHRPLLKRTNGCSVKSQEVSKESQSALLSFTQSFVKLCILMTSFSEYINGKLAMAPVVILNVGFKTAKKYEATLLQNSPKI